MAKKKKEKKKRKKAAKVVRDRHRLYSASVQSVDVDIDFYAADRRQGVISDAVVADNCTLAGCGHAVLALGYLDHPDVEGGGFVLIKNSWGESWGDGGLAYATYAWLESGITDAYAVRSVSP